MDKLLEFLDVEMYDKLMEVLGDKSEEFISDFEQGKITEEDVSNKLKELGLVEEKEDTSEEDVETNEEDKTEDGKLEDVEIDESKAIEIILGSDWSNDIDSIPYEPLRGFIKGLQEIADKASCCAKYELEILKEALKQNMYDVDDALKYISVDDIEWDIDGGLVGIAEKFAELKKNKPHLFKQLDLASGTNPINSGFEPVDKNTNIKPSSYAQALELSKKIKL